MRGKFKVQKPGTNWVNNPIFFQSANNAPTNSIAHRTQFYHQKDDKNF